MMTTVMGIGSSVSSPPKPVVVRQALAPQNRSTRGAGDSFQRKGVPPQPALKKPSLFQRLFQPKTSVTKSQAMRFGPWVVAGAQHDRKEPRNPIPFESLDAMLKEVENDVAPEVGSLLKKGYADGLKHLLNVGNQMLAEMNELTDQGREKVELVVFYENPRQGTLRDPFNHQALPYEIDPDKQEVCMIPTPLRLFKKFDAMSHWSTIANGKQPNSDLEYLEFAPQELAYLKETTQNHRKAKPEHRFDLNHKDQLADYAFQLFNMLYNVQLAKEEMPQEVGHGDSSHYKIGIRSTHPEGGPISIQDISHLFPGCRLGKAPPHGSEKADGSLFLAEQKAYLENLFSRGTSYE
ncbi:hypothetical protein [Vampirovibrio sp.]|uniref:hypothetical protein n=1 Tax=Vampirovibrio sp. TaxID=2717857 RepID=UPI00359401B5